MAPEVAVEIVVDDLRGEQVIRLIGEHQQEMRGNSDPGSCHVLGVETLREQGITVWTAWHEGALLGCGGLKELDTLHGEIKSMRTASEHRRKGVAAALLAHIVAESRRRGYERVSLETGSQALFAPARRLYAGFGFVECAHFGEYAEDPNSTFMTLELTADPLQT